MASELPLSLLVSETPGIFGNMTKFSTAAASSSDSKLERNKNGKHKTRN